MRIMKSDANPEPTTLWAWQQWEILLDPVGVVLTYGLGAMREPVARSTRTMRFLDSAQPDPHVPYEPSVEIRSLRYGNESNPIPLFVLEKLVGLCRKHLADTTQEHTETSAAAPSSNTSANKRTGDNGAGDVAVMNGDGEGAKDSSAEGAMASHFALPPKGTPLDAEHAAKCPVCGQPSVWWDAHKQQACCHCCAYDATPDYEPLAPGKSPDVSQPAEPAPDNQKPAVASDQPTEQATPKRIKRRPRRTQKSSE